jgi:hypothetical protein
MNDGPANHSAMIETTDCLEAVGVFRAWKNLFFLVVLACLLLTQAAFWLVDLGWVEAAGTGRPSAVAAVADPNAGAQDANAPAVQAESAEAPRGTGIRGLPARLLNNLDTGRLARIVELVNSILIVAVGLFGMAVFFCLIVSLVGRLGGIRHISRAFFLSIIMLVLVVPWQSLLGSRVPGVTYTLPELMNSMAIKDESLLNTIVYYLRFSGYWVIYLFLLLLSQFRSARWTKSILRRLEII